MTNEEKARVLSTKGCLGAYISKDMEAHATQETQKRLSIYCACMEAMEWKDEQIDTILLTIEACLRSFFESQGNTQESITNFIDALKKQINENLNKYDKR